MSSEPLLWPWTPAEEFIYHLLRCLCSCGTLMTHFAALDGDDDE